VIVFIDDGVEVVKLEKFAMLGLNLFHALLGPK
jgi:hypothetical protein